MKTESDSKPRSMLSYLQKNCLTVSSLDDDDLFETALVSRFVACGIPLQTIQKVFDQDSLTVLKSMNRGFHSRRSQSRKVLRTWFPHTLTEARLSSSFTPLLLFLMELVKSYLDIVRY